jgi:hypothetical protein
MWKSLIIGVASVCSSMCLTLNSVKAAIVDYNFDANYFVGIGLKPLSESLSTIYFQGTSDDALYGLNTLGGNSFVSIDGSGNYVASTSPTYILEQMKLASNGEMNLDDGIVILGNGLNKLYLHEYASGALDSVNGTGFGTAILKVFGGEGLFKEATGYIDVWEDIKVVGFDEYNNSQFVAKQGYKFNIKVSPQPQPIPENDGILFLLAPVAMIYGLKKFRTSSIAANF